MPRRVQRGIAVALGSFGTTRRRSGDMLGTPRRPGTFSQQHITRSEPFGLVGRRPTIRAPEHGATYSGAARTAAVES